MLRRTAVILAAALALTGCGGTAPGLGASRAAADSASRLLDAAFRGDRAAFESLVDRAAVREDLRRQVTAVARSAGLDVDGGPSDFALDRMISPAAIRLVHASGRPLAAAPTQAQVAPLMQTVAGGRACLREPQGGCALTFARAGGGWRLVGMKAANLRIELAANPPSLGRLASAAPSR